MSRKIENYKGYIVKEYSLMESEMIGYKYCVINNRWSTTEAVWMADDIQECREWIDGVTKSVTAYKLFRLKGGKLFPLFINRTEETKRNKWLKAECIPTKGFAVRQGWHCCLKPIAPHLKERLASGEVRVWVECEVRNYETYNRPESQGGEWILADEIKIKRILTAEELEELRNELG